MRCVLCLPPLGRSVGAGGEEALPRTYGQQPIAVEASLSRPSKGPEGTAA